MFDCVVVGAGPAGGAAAYHLAKAGRSVVILEKDALPRYKPCGGGISPAIAQWFDFDFSPVISRKISNVRFTWKLEDPVDVVLKTPEPMWMVQRDVFDHFLVQQAQRQGAELRDQTEVTGIQFVGDHWQINTAQGPIEARYIVAADGARGPMAKWLGFKDRKQRQAAAMEATSPTPSEDAAVHFEFGLIKNGCIFNFPKANGYSIGLSTFLGGDLRDPAGAMTDYGAHFGITHSGSQQYFYPLCIWDGNQILHTQNAVVAGEAASMVDPFIAEGVRPAIFSGVKAAAAIHQALAGDLNALENYTKTIHEEWGSDMAWAQRLAGVFYRIPKIGYKIGVKRPSAPERMGKILCGEMRYSDIAGRAIKRLSGSLIPGMGG